MEYHSCYFEMSHEGKCGVRSSYTFVFLELYELFYVSVTVFGSAMCELA